MKDKCKKVAIEAALKSGEFIRKSVGKIKTVSYKGVNNIVTDVDKKAEKIIIGTILSSFPGHSILSEEVGVRGKPSSFKWVIDPLDGTTNFARGFPFFSVSIALEEEGRVILGVVYDPVRGELFLAEHKKGSYLNEKRIRVSSIRRLSDAFLATGFAYGVKKTVNKNIRNFKSFLVRSMAIRRAGSAALDFCYVACGRFDGYWELELNPWDCAAGSLIVKEAGGSVTRFNRERYSHYDREVLATNGFIHDEMVEVLSGKA